MILKNVASQGIYLFAYNSSGPVTGDAANITGYVSKDSGAAAAFGTANPSEINATHMAGVYWQPLAQGETNANALALAWSSTTSGVSIDPIEVLTSGANLPTALFRGGVPSVPFQSESPDGFIVLMGIASKTQIPLVYSVTNATSASGDLL